MHSPLAQALRAVPGTPGLPLRRALVAGERDPQHLAAWRKDRCQKDAAARALALSGTWRAAPLVVLPHALAVCACSTVPLQAWDAPIARPFSVMPPRCECRPEDTASAEAPAPPPSKPEAHSKQAPAVDTRAPLRRIPGVELGAGHGISASLAQTISAEMGTERRTWEDAQHVGSWVGRAPHKDLSGGTVLKSRTLKPRNRASHACRRAAQSVSRSPCAFGAFSRRMHGRRGPAQALVATAPKIARTVYGMLKNRVPYHDSGAAE
jgi:transposase